MENSFLFKADKILKITETQLLRTQPTFNLKCWITQNCWTLFLPFALLLYNLFALFKMAEFVEKVVLVGMILHCTIGWSYEKQIPGGL